MDFDLALNRHRDELLRIVVSLFAMLGLVQGVALGRISRALSRKVLRILTPAESALRRLIVIVARGLVAEPTTPRPRTKRTGAPKDTAKKRQPRTPAFNLSDKHEPWLPPKSKRKRRNPLPRVWYIDHDPRWPAQLARDAARLRDELHQHQPAPRPPPEPAPKPEDDCCVDSSRLIRRLLAIKAALEDIPRQARRLARWKANRERRADAGKLVHTEPLREGRPPGFRETNSHEVDRLLDECTWLAMKAMKADTS